MRFCLAFICCTSALVCDAFSGAWLPVEGVTKLMANRIEQKQKKHNVQNFRHSETYQSLLLEYGATENIALTINLMSVFASAFTILFMFWSVTILLSNLVKNKDTFTKTNQIAILSSAVVASLSFAFTDSFWFSAVEAEVYAMAAFIMSVLFYAGLRWESEMFSPRGDKWVVLIAFIVGLSFGVHFMGLLTIPAIGFLYGSELPMCQSS